MTEFQLRDLKLMMGDTIAIMNMKGERTLGRFNSRYENGMTIFSFQNFSNGKTETINITELQRMEVTFRIPRPKDVVGQQSMIPPRTENE